MGTANAKEIVDRTISEAYDEENVVEIEGFHSARTENLEGPNKKMGKKGIKKKKKKKKIKEFTDSEMNTSAELEVERADEIPIVKHTKKQSPHGGLPTPLILRQRSSLGSKASEEDSKKTSLLKHYLLFFGFVLLCGYILSLCEAAKEKKIMNRRFRRGRRIKEKVDELILQGILNPSFKEDLKLECDFVSSDQTEILNWNWSGATYFVGTITTTIGYGSYTPQTNTGKILTCVIAIFGISWFGFILALAASKAESALIFILKMYRTGSHVVDRVRRKKEGRKKIKKSKSSDGFASTTNRLLTVLSLNIGFILFLTVLAAGDDVLTPGNAVYMAIISFTTVGLGDVAPPFLQSPEYSPLVRGIEYICLTLVAFIGLTLLSMLLRAVELYFADGTRLDVIGLTADATTLDRNNDQKYSHHEYPYLFPDDEVQDQHRKEEDNEKQSPVTLHDSDSESDNEVDILQC